MGHASSLQCSSDSLQYYILLGVRSLANARVELDSFKRGKQ